MWILKFSIQVVKQPEDALIRQERRYGTVCLFVQARVHVEQLFRFDKEIISNLLKKAWNIRQIRLGKCLYM